MRWDSTRAQAPAVARGRTTRRALVAALLIHNLACRPAGLFADEPAAAAQGRVIRAGVGTTRPDLAKALAECRPGDTLVIADGTYPDTLTVTAGGDDGPGRSITIRAEHSRKAVFSRAGLAASIDASFVRIEGLVFDAQYGNSTCVRAKGRHLQIVDCEIRRAGTIDAKPWGDGLQLFDTEHCLIERCHIHHCLASRDGRRDDSHGVRITHSRDIIIRGCVIDLVSGDCVQADPDRQPWDNVLIEACKLSGGKVVEGDPYAHPRFPAGAYTAENAVDTKCPRGDGDARPRITVRNCEVYGFRGIDNAAAFNIKETCDAVIDRCTVSDSQIGLRLRAPARVKVTNCVLYDNDTHCRYEDEIPRLHLYHCTFGAATGKGRGPFQEVGASPDLRVWGCLFLGDEKPRQAAAPSNRAADVGAFVDAAGGDYRLKAPLPVGEEPGPPMDEESKVDRGGAPRVGPSDAGAYQFRAGRNEQE